MLYPSTLQYFSEAALWVFLDFKDFMKVLTWMDISVMALRIFARSLILHPIGLLDLWILTHSQMHFFDLTVSPNLQSKDPKSLSPLLFSSWILFCDLIVYKQSYFQVHNFVFFSIILFSDSELMITSALHITILN